MSNVLIAITANQTYLECLRVKLKKVLRIILSYGIETQINKMYSTLQFLKMDDIYEFELYKFMHQLHHGKLPEVFYKSFTKTTSVHAHNTRFKQSAFYALSRVNKSFCKNQLSYRGTKLSWCKLDSNYKSIHLTSCKKRFKKYLLDRYWHHLGLQIYTYCTFNCISKY